MDTNILILAALLSLSSMATYGSLGATPPIAFRIQAFLLILILIYGGAVQLSYMYWGVFHAHDFIARYSNPDSLFPPAICLSIVVLSLIAGVVGLFIGLQISQRRLRGFDWAVRCTPYLLLVSLMDLVRVITSPRIQSHAIIASHNLYVRDLGRHVLQNHATDPQKPHSAFAAAFAFAVIAMVVVGFYSWLYRFAMSAENRKFISEADLSETKGVG